MEEGRIKPGDHVVLSGFGAGLAWGATVIHWTGEMPEALPLRRRVLMSLYSHTPSLFSTLRRLQRRLDALWGTVTQFLRDLFRFS